MNGTLPGYGTAVSKKFWMAITGIILFAYVLVHMIGNLKLFQGPEKLNSYAEWLRQVGGPVLPPSGLLWIVRGVLLISVVIHTAAAFQLTVMNRQARRIGYVRFVPLASNYAARTMRWSGVIVLLFIVYHLLHLTWGTAHRDFRPGDVYHNVVSGFQNVWVSAAYVAAQLALGFHLYHGLWSLFQSMGWNHMRFNRWRKIFAVSFTAIIAIGNLSLPIAVLLGVVS
jgi:succinate dehydrogenase / fumarate reductase cytochrome b subunit